MTSVEGSSLAVACGETRSEIDLPDLVRSYSGLLFRVAHCIVRNRDEAEDVVQDVFVRVLQRRGALWEVRDMRVWLIRIAWNLALDRRRRVRPDQMDAAFAEALAGSEMLADHALAQTQAMRTVMAEIERLPAKERQVLLLSAMDELGTAEMAAVMGKSESAVRAILFRARARLRERLEKGGAGEAFG